MIESASFGNIETLAARYGTPLVVYSEAQLLHNAAALRQALPASAALAYSIKANPNPVVLKTLLENGFMAEAASAGELQLALTSGANQQRLLLGGPAKTEQAIELALSAKIPLIVVESATELARVNAVAQSTGNDVEVLVRVNPAQLKSSPALPMAGFASPFGVDEEALPQLIKGMQGGAARYAGLHMYAGSQHFDARDIVSNTRYLCQLALALHNKGCPAARVLDFGGGFGVPADAGQPTLNLTLLREELDALYRQEVAELTRLGLQQTLFESGRYLVSQAACYVARVLDVKYSRGQRFVILDGGINHLGMHQLQYRTSPPSLRVWGRQASTQDEAAIVVGPTCAPIDVTHDTCKLPVVRVGDLVVIENFGAYTLNFSPLYFCGHPWPAEVWLNSIDNSARLVRQRGSIESACGPGYIASNLQHCVSP